MSMMARSLSPSLAALPKSSSSRLLALRAHSSHSSSSPDVVVGGGGGDSSSDPLLGKLEDVIHHLIVRRSEPDWLPFRPGSSYWVPPRSKSRGIAQLIGKLASSSPHGDSLLSSSSSSSCAAASPHGWPSPSFFIHGALPYAYPEEAVQTSDNGSQSEDEEG
ncbi:uncharacterized protein J3R85_000752 [Psidium guajava]|nr:uncharacterized protein J3R85_000752 [Psidium guajava]